jgi:hypothetical protein
VVISKITAPNGPEPVEINDVQSVHNGLARVHVGGHVVETSHDVWWEGGAWYYVDKNGKVIHLYKVDTPE